MGKTNLTLDLTVDVRTDYLRGLNISELSEKYKLSVPIITHVLNGDDRISRRLAEEGIQKIMQKETDAIVQIKDNALSLISLALGSARKSVNPHLFLKDIATIMKELDHIQRLNQSRPTEIKEERSFLTQFDVNAAMEQLKTPEDKMEFLRHQLNPQNYDKDTKDFGRAAEVVATPAA